MKTTSDFIALYLPFIGIEMNSTNRIFLPNKHKVKVFCFDFIYHKN